MEGDYSFEIDKLKPLDLKPLDLWSTPDGIAKEISQKSQQVNYQTIISDHRVVLFGEDHANSQVRDHLANHAGDLKNVGITHYAIEAPSTEASRDAFTRLKRKEPVDLSGVQLGPFVPEQGRSNYEKAIRAMTDQGIQIVPIDIDQTQTHTKEDREAFITKEIQQIVEADPAAKVAVLIGGNHTSKTSSPEGVPYLGKRIVDANIPRVTIQFAGGTGSTHINLLEGAKMAGLANQEFMLDMKPYAKSKHVAFGAGETDYVIHLPQRPKTSSMEFSDSPEFIERNYRQ